MLQEGEVDGCVVGARISYADAVRESLHSLHVGRHVVLREGEIAVYCDLEEQRRANLKFIEVETRGDQAAFAEEIEKLVHV